MNAGKIHVDMWLHTASIKSTVGNNTRLFLSPFLFLPAQASLWPERSGTTT